MQKKHIEVIKRHMKSMQQKKLINFRFIVLICIAFVLPNLAFTTHQKAVGFTNLHSAGVHNNYFDNGTTDQQAPQINFFVEAESEDEDDVHDEHVNDFIASYQTFNAFQHSDAINTLYLRLASNNQHKADLPFFILYHSWKSQLV